MPAGAWIVRSSKNLAPSATPTWAVGTADSDFPLANVLTLEPDVVAKANENTATLRLTWGASKTLVGLALFNVNFPGVTIGLTNNGGMSTQNVTVPAPEDNLQIHAFFDLDGVASNAGTQWNIAVASTRPVTIGTVVAIEEWTELPIRVGDRKRRQRFPVIEHRTGYQKRLQYRIPVTARQYQCQPFRARDRNTVRTVFREALGPITPLAFLPDRQDTEIALVQLVGDLEEQPENTHGSFPANTARGGHVDMPLTLEEVSSGVSLL
jgi:hypothetical protein